jgi:hypothetical protein
MGRCTVHLGAHTYSVCVHQCTWKPHLHPDALHQPLVQIEKLMNTNTQFTIQLSPEKTLELVSQIASGLLASGHFTREHNGDDEYGEEQVLMCRRLENGKPRYSVAVVSAAFDILGGLQSELETQVNENSDRILDP